MWLNKHNLSNASGPRPELGTGETGKLDEEAGLLRVQERRWVLEHKDTQEYTSYEKRTEGQKLIHRELRSMTKDI